MLDHIVSSLQLGHWPWPVLLGADYHHCTPDMLTGTSISSLIHPSACQFVAGWQADSARLSYLNFCLVAVDISLTVAESSHGWTEKNVTQAVLHETDEKS